MGKVTDADDAVQIAEDYADQECVGELGEVTDVTESDDVYTVEFRTHTFSDAYDHSIRINHVGNVLSHDRTP